MRVSVILFFFFYLIITPGQFAQDREIDSLSLLIEQSQPDTGKVNNLILMSGKYCRTDKAKAINFAIEAQELAEKLNFNKGVAYSLKALGMAYYFQGEIPDALVYWQQSLQKFEEIGDQLGMSNMLNNLGAVYFVGGDDNKAVEYYIPSLKISEQIKDTLRIATALLNIGAVYFNKSETHDRALEYYKRALPLSLTLDDFDAIGTTNLNIGEIFYAKAQYDSALFYFERSLAAYRNSETGNVARALSNIGNVYAQKGAFTKAIQSQMESLDFATKSIDKLEMTYALIGLGNTYQLKKEYNKSIDYFLRAEKLSKELSADTELRDIYFGLSTSYKLLEDYKKALEYHLVFAEVNKRLYDHEMSSKINEQTLGHEIENQQGQIELMTKEKEIRELAMQQQKLIRNALIVFLILVMIITVGAIRNYLNKVKVNKILDKQKDEIEGLLLNILPARIANELQVNGHATPRSYKQVTVLFTDFKDFTKISSGMTPEDLVKELNIFFHAFDSIIEAHNLEKIKTIGDAYMCAGGIPKTNNTHPFDAIKAGLAMQEFMKTNNEKLIAEGKTPWNLRIGIHTGPVVAGVVGKKKYAYDIWGSAVNLASRMESNGEAGKVNISSTTYELVKEQFNCHHRGKISAKNVGEVDMYFIESEITEKASVIEKV
jgi:class 3 adenylate cyclase/tetratricopeptide (TPR) repeat protein